jgi:hypothetical protein
MCLSAQPYRHNKVRCPDQPVPVSDAETAEPGQQPDVAEVITNIQGLNYVAVRNCDLERFSIM